MLRAEDEVRYRHVSFWIIRTPLSYHHQFQLLLLLLLLLLPPLL